MEPQKEIPLELLQKDIEENGEESDFHFVAELIKKCKLLAPLLIFEPNEQYGWPDSFYINQCTFTHIHTSRSLTIPAKDYYINDFDN